MTVGAYQGACHAAMLFQHSIETSLHTLHLGVNQTPVFELNSLTGRPSMVVQLQKIDFHCFVE